MSYQSSARDPFSRTYAGSVCTADPARFTASYLPTVTLTLPEWDGQGQERAVRVQARGWVCPVPDSVN